MGVFGWNGARGVVGWVRRLGKAETGYFRLGYALAVEVGGTTERHDRGQEKKAPKLFIISCIHLCAIAYDGTAACICCACICCAR